MPFLGVRVSQELKERLAATGRPASQVVREALEMYFGIVRERERTALERLVDQRIQDYLGTRAEIRVHMKSEASEGRSGGQRGGPADEDRLFEALMALRSFHHRGHEPAVSELAGMVGMAPASLSTMLKGQGIEAVSARRGGRALRVYPRSLGPQIEATLKGKDVKPLRDRN